MLLLFFWTSIASSWSLSPLVSALYWYYENTVLRFMWYRLDLLNTVIIVNLFVCGQHIVFVINIVTCECAIFILRKITVACMSLLLSSIDLLWIYYLIMFYFKLTNDATEKWCMVKWCNGEIKNRTGHFFLTNIEYVYLFYFRTQHFCW